VSKHSVIKPKIQMLIDIGRLDTLGNIFTKRFISVKFQVQLMDHIPNTHLFLEK